jgi:hypothetical protein
MVYISDWQTNLKKVVLRIEWVNENGQNKDYDHEFYIHLDRRRGE